METDPPPQCAPPESLPTLSASVRVKGGIIGLLTGDAIGVPYEFLSADEIPFIDTETISPPAGFPRTHAAAPDGAWSDDGAQAIALLASLLAHGTVCLPDFANRLVQWQRDGLYAVDGIVFDVGTQTSIAIRNLITGSSPETSARRDEFSNGNGSLMRVLPLVLWHHGSDENLVDLAMRQSVVTHAHIRSQLCCALYCLWARRILHGSMPTNAWTSAVQQLHGIGRGNKKWSEELAIIAPKDMPRGTGSGYVVDCLHSAYTAVTRGTSFAHVIRIAVLFGNDTDTTACVAGGIAGIQYGVEGIPEAWRGGLAGMDMVNPLLERLLVMYE